MLRILDNLTLLNRFDVKASPELLNGDNDAATGTFVSKVEDEIDFPTAGARGVMAVWTESNRDGTPGWSPDVKATGALTVVYGHYRALTTQYAGAPSPGDSLGVNATGDLAVIDDGVGDTLPATAATVAVCTKAEHSVEHLTRDHNVIEFITV